MTTESTNDISPKLFSLENMKSYILVLLGLLGISILYHVITGLPVGESPYGMDRPFRPSDEILQPPTGAPTGGNFLDQIWPLLGQLMVPTIGEILFAASIFLIFSLVLYVFYRKNEFSPHIVGILVVGIILIIATNLIHGWLVLENSIGSGGEIYTDALQISDWLSFISNYEILQPDLSTHALTQPPGAVLTFYFLNQLVGTPGLVGIALCAISAFVSVFFLNGIFKKFYDQDKTRFLIMLFLLLPAVQVYYLANIYAVVATLVFGVLYFYLHDNRYLSYTGSLLCFFLGTFVSFLFVFTGFFLFIFELMNSRRDGYFGLSAIRENGLVSWLRTMILAFQKVIFIGFSVLAIYGILYFALGFNYINAFLFASASENSTGFMLIADPLFYIQTRIRNILDILIFYGPVLSVLSYRGLKILKEKVKVCDNSALKYNLVISSFIALSLLFVAGTPHHGETARICMFLLPFLLIPALTYLEELNFSKREYVKLLAIVFLQTILMQLIGTYVW